jgi:Origin recognition complex subunit 2
VHAVDLLNIHYHREGTDTNAALESFLHTKPFKRPRPSDDPPGQASASSSSVAGSALIEPISTASSSGGLFSVDLSIDDNASKRSSRAYTRKTPVVPGRYTLMKSRVYLVIHTIESAVRQSYESQLCLAMLANCPSVSMVASADHWNVASLWDSHLLSLFRWRLDTTPGTPFHVTESMYNTIVGKKASSLNKDTALEYVMASLSNSHREILSIILAVFNSAPMAQSHSPVSKKTKMLPANSVLFSVVFKKCQRNLVTKNQSEFDKFLQELTDHNVVSVVVQDDEKYLVLNVDEAELSNLLVSAADNN